MKIAILLAVCVALAGCSTIPSRIEKNRAAFQRLTPAERLLVEGGEVREGMNADAVYIAWGRPDEVTRGSERGQDLETWTYFRFSQQAVSNYDYVPRRAGRIYSAEPIYNPRYVTNTSLDRRAVFHAGKVISLEIAGW